MNVFAARPASCTVTAVRCHVIMNAITDHLYVYNDLGAAPATLEANGFQENLTRWALLP